MVAGSRSQRRAQMTLRLVLLTAGVVVTLLPFAYMLSTSFKPNAMVLEIPLKFFPQHPTAGNYVTAWTSNRFARYFLNSVIVSVGSTAAALLLSSMMAFAFARFRFPGRTVLFGLLLIALMVPTMMMLIPQFLLARELHLLNTLWGLVAFYTGGNLAFNTFLLQSFFQDIPFELEEAMIVDGASPWTRYWRLILPLSRPALATAAIFTFLAAWDEFTWALTIINDPSKYTLPIAIALFQGQHSTSWGLVFAASVIAIAPVLVIFAIFQRQFVAGLAAGAVKA